MDDAALVERYLEHVRVEKRLAARTVELYALDLQKLAENATKEGVELTHVLNAHVRRLLPLPSTSASPACRSIQP